MEAIKTYLPEFPGGSAGEGPGVTELDRWTENELNGNKDNEQV